MDDQRLEELHIEAKRIEQEFLQKLERLAKLAEVCSADLVTPPKVKCSWGLKPYSVCPECSTIITWQYFKEKKASLAYKFARCPKCDWEYATCTDLTKVIIV